DEIFSVTSGRKRNGLVIRPGSRADDRAVANASRRFGRHTARGGCGSQMSEAVQCYGAYRSVLTGWIAVIGSATATTFQFVMQCLATLFGGEPFRSHHFQTCYFAKTLCSFTCQKYVFGLLHHGPCRQHGIARSANSGNCPTSARCAIHDRGIHLVRFVGRENGSPTRIEERIFFQSNHGNGHGVESFAALVKNR